MTFCINILKQNLQSQKNFPYKLCLYVNDVNPTMGKTLYRSNASEGEIINSSYFSAKQKSLVKTIFHFYPQKLRILENN